MELFMFGVIVMAYVMVIAKRIQTLVTGFALQSLFLFILVLKMAAFEKSAELLVIAGLIGVLKVALIPWLLGRIVRQIRVNENLGLVVNPMLSLVISLLLTYLAYLFASNVMYLQGKPLISAFAISLSVMLIGLLLMVVRLKAIAQVVGILVMENGAFLAAVALCGSMPFLLDIVIFFDIFVCVIILGIFMFRINQLFTHIDVDKLTTLKG
jgi:hydrogenase-4 component E